MVASRTRLMVGSRSARFWLSAFCAALMPTSIGYQHLSTLLSRHRSVSYNWGEHLIASPFGTIEPATFRYARPIGTAMPKPPGFQLVNYDPGAPGANVWSIDRPLTARPARRIAYPMVNRRLKGDRLSSAAIAPASAKAESAPHVKPVTAPPASPPFAPPAPATMSRPKDAQARDAAPLIVRKNAAGVSSSALPPVKPRGQESGDGAEPRAASPTAQDNARDFTVDDDTADATPKGSAAGGIASPDGEPSFSFIEEGPADRDTQIYFDIGAMGSPSAIERWAPGAEPVMVTSSVDTDIKISALEGINDNSAGGETIAGKDDPSRLESPAQRLHLSGKPRARAEKCLANAVYFEARGEPLKGQEAVAQVVMNRVFSGYYPTNVCGVVYQNADRHLACQFTFACDGIPDIVDDPHMWRQARRIAKDTLDGKIWLPEVAHATHYHAFWVHPGWVHEMTRVYRVGAHTFYRPRAWGNGSDEPVWGSAPKTSRADARADRPQAPTMNSEAVADAPDAGVLFPVPAAATSGTTAKL
jgi:Cell Wall Hydrolase